MTAEEAIRLVRASENLVKCGRGVCSKKTFDEIVSVLVPQQRISSGDETPDMIRNLCFAGVELSVSPWMPDGEIIPNPDWSYLDRQTD